MDQMGATSQEADVKNGEFSAVLTPYRSLSRRGFVMMMAAVSAVCFTAGLVFAMAGAWPIFGFFVLDVLLIYSAFKLNYRAARAYETISISGDQLTVTKVHASGRSNSWTFNPYWARVKLTAQTGRASQLLLSSHGRRLVLGSFLSEDERQDFAAALSSALASSQGQTAS
jgi:uncharacterized membrane protein